MEIIGLPFLLKDAVGEDILDVDSDECFEPDFFVAADSKRGYLALNKYWDRIWVFQGAQVGFLRSVSPDRPHRFFVDINGSSLAFLPSQIIFNLLKFASLQHKFIGNRIDVALDFPKSELRLSSRPWRQFQQEGLIVGCRTVRVIESLTRSVLSTTSYLGSRESPVFVRLYDKQIDDFEFDRWEVEFKNYRAEFLIKELADRSDCSLPDNFKFLYKNAISSISLRFSAQTDFFKDYKYCREIKPLSRSPHLDIQRSAAFISRIGPTLATIRELLGPDRFADFVASSADCGKPRMKPRHWQMYYAAKLFGYTLAFFAAVGLPFPVIAGGICPVRQPSDGFNNHLVRKFPIDIVLPNQSEQAYLNQVGDGCFAINSGIDFDRVCLPGMIVRALQPLVVLSVGLRFIFSDG
jgi:hypothetical protein